MSPLSSPRRSGPSRVATSRAAASGAAASGAAASGAAASAASTSLTVAVGEAMHALAAELYPLHRSITGEGVRQTLERIAARIPLEIQEVPSGFSAFDWTVPAEWNIRDAAISDLDGNRLIDYRQSNLHVAGYSEAVCRQMTLAELEPHLISLPEQPDDIPFHSLHFRQGWAFCLSHRQLEELRRAPAETPYRVFIDSTLAPGALTFGELLIPGESPAEVLVSTHVCHPSMGNDNLSGIAVATFLAERLAAQPRRLSYRLLFTPATIGAVTWLALRQHSVLQRIQYGLVLACLGDDGGFTYKSSRRQNSPLDLAARDVLHASGQPHSLRPFTPNGYDERQFNSPAFDLAVGRLTRTPNGEFPQYHTSADDLDFIRPANLAASLEMCLAILQRAEQDPVYVNQHPWCEPRLSKHELYQGFSHGGNPDRDFQDALMWLLNLSDGGHSLAAIADRANLPIPLLQSAAERLQACGLLQEPLA